MEYINELILKSLYGFEKDLYSKDEMLEQLFLLQGSLVNILFDNIEVDNRKLTLIDVVTQLERMNLDKGGVIDKELDAFKKDCEKLSSIIKMEVSGRIGENRAFDSLETVRCNHILVKNIELTKGNHHSEIDAVVLTEKAIFLIEVKNSNSNILIDEQGNYYRKSMKKFDYLNNIGEIMNSKDFLLREVVKSVGIDDPNIVSLLVFANSRVYVTNKFEHIKTCYLSNVPHIISKYEGDVLYSQEDMDIIVSSLNRNRFLGLYPIPIDITDFKTNYATIITTLMNADDLSLLKYRLQSELFDRKLEKVSKVYEELKLESELESKPNTYDYDANLKATAAFWLTAPIVGLPIASVIYGLGMNKKGRSIFKGEGYEEKKQKNDNNEE